MRRRVGRRQHFPHIQSSIELLEARRDQRVDGHRAEPAARFAGNRHPGALGRQRHVVLPGRRQLVERMRHGQQARAQRCMAVMVKTPRGVPKHVIDVIGQAAPGLKARKVGRLLGPPHQRTGLVDQRRLHQRRHFVTWQANDDTQMTREHGHPAAVRRCGGTSIVQRFQQRFERSDRHRCASGLPTLVWWDEQAVCQVQPEPSSRAPE